MSITPPALARRITLLTALALLPLCAASGCSKGPASAQLEQTLQQRLDENFGKGLFQLSGLSRKGHYPLAAEQGQTRVLVYYNANVRFLRAHRLAAWNQLNVGSLVSVLGATPLGVRGVKPKGNAKGDQLTVHGALAWARGAGDKSWRAVAFTAATKGKGRSRANQLPYRKHLDRLGVIGKQLSKARKDPALSALTGELTTLVARSERRLGQALGWLTLSTGRSGGEYDRQGRGLVRILHAAKQKARAYRSAGSRENLQLVARGEVLFAYAQNDIAAMASKGAGVFASRPLPRLRALCSLYPEALQIVTLADRKLQGLEALRGKRIDIGPEGSGMRINALALIRAAGMNLASFAKVRGRGLPGALLDLKHGQVDAVFLTSAFPNAGVQQLAATAKVALLPIPASVRDKLQAAQSYLLPQTIPDKTYAGVRGPRETVGVTALLVARDDAPAAKVEALLTHLFANVDKLSRGSLQAYFISRATAKKGLSLPLHPAAAAFLAKKP
jgi:TRAP transporter TAXI family solute receptor